MADSGSVLFFFCVFGCLVQLLDADAITCESGFCYDYGYEVGCASPAPQCSINNETYSGMWMSSPTLCNCCEYCLPFYGAGEYCSLGGAGAGTTVGRCGEGLTCVTGADGASYCQRMSAAESECHGKQDDYDDRYRQGLTGALEFRPVCDDKGRYGPVDCVPTQTCFCQSEDGERIFGEAPYQGLMTLQNMQCGCSRAHHKIAQNIGEGVPYPVVGPRCSQDGNYDSVQCLNRTCFCVSRFTGVRLGDIEVDLDSTPITELPCYEAAQDLFSRFYPNEPPYNYTSPCLDDMREKIRLVRESEEDGYNVDYFTTVRACHPDGTYGRVESTRNNTNICIDEWGDQIGDYEAEFGTPAYQDMNCNCAITASHLSDSLERPVCCRNGNFRPIQCRRGSCRCVDSHGRQVGTEAADVEDLPCFSEDWMTC